MDIKEISAKKQNLTQQIQSLISDFEVETETEVSDINLERMKRISITESKSTSIIRIQLKLEIP